MITLCTLTVSGCRGSLSTAGKAWSEAVQVTRYPPYGYATAVACRYPPVPAPASDIGSIGVGSAEPSRGPLEPFRPAPRHPSSGTDRYKVATPQECSDSTSDPPTAASSGLRRASCKEEMLDCLFFLNCKADGWVARCQFQFVDCCGELPRNISVARCQVQLSFVDCAESSCPEKFLNVRCRLLSAV